MIDALDITYNDGRVAIQPDHHDRCRSDDDTVEDTAPVYDFNDDVIDGTPVSNDNANVDGPLDTPALENGGAGDR